jgi:hypothetical protein
LIVSLLAGVLYAFDDGGVLGVKIFLAYAVPLLLATLWEFRGALAKAWRRRGGRL